jgi:hypothetical protein
MKSCVCHFCLFGPLNQHLSRRHVDTDVNVQHGVLHWLLELNTNFTTRAWIISCSEAHHIRQGIYIKVMLRLCIVFVFVFISYSVNP